MADFYVIFWAAVLFFLSLNNYVENLDQES